jgi:phosphomannomutase
MKEENLTALQAAVKKEKAALGVAYDGDADRVGFVDENGNPVRADFVFAAILPELLARHPGAAALYDLRSSKIVPEIIKNLGSKPKMTRVGHAFIKKDMAKFKASAASELSAHYYFKDFFGAECSDLVMLYMLKILSDSGQTLSQIIAPLQKYFQSGEINFEVRDKEAAISRILKKYRGDAKNFTDMDGVRLEFSSGDDWWWFSVRASNTEPLLRLNVEARNSKLLAQKTTELTKIIKK